MCVCVCVCALRQTHIEYNLLEIITSLSSQLACLAIVASCVTKKTRYKSIPIYIYIYIRESHILVGRIQAHTERLSARLTIPQ